MRKRIVAAILSGIMCIMLSGCVSVSLTPVQPLGDVELPLPQATVPLAPAGDSHAEQAKRVTLYFISGDRQQLSPMSRTLRLTGDESTAEKAIERLVEGTGTASLLPVVPLGTRMNFIEQSQGIATVDLSVDALALDAQGLCWMKAAIANTLTALPGINRVNVLIDGKEESALTLPTGTLGATTATLTALWAQQRSDEDRFSSSPASAQIEREVTLYFGAWLDERLLPEARKVVLGSANLATTLIDALREGPSNQKQAHAVLPADAYLRRAPEVATLEDGRRVLLLWFEDDLYPKLERDSLSRWQLFSAFAYTLCRFIPQIDGLTISVGDQIVTSIDNGVRRLTFEDGVITPEAFDSAVARMARLYFADENGKLCTVDRAMDRAKAAKPRALIEQLIAGPYVFDAGALPIVPEGVTDADILGVRVEDGVALVNLSSNFYRLCQGLGAAEERNLIYAIVNTLCELDNVDRVRFYVEGGVVQTLANGLCLLAELMPNPGIIAQG